MPGKPPKPASLWSLAQEAGRTFSGLFIYLVPSALAVPFAASASYLTRRPGPSIRPGLLVTNAIGIGLALAAGWGVQKVIPSPSLPQIFAAYMGVCGALALAATTGIMALVGWTK